ncbi:MAG: HAD-IC family P-type ATPase [Bacilli bacterium]
MSKKNIEIKRYEASIKQGLSKKQVEYNKSIGQVNKVRDKKKDQYFKIFIKNIFTFFNMLLLALAIILIIAGKWKSCFFIIVFVANTFITMFQDLRAKALVDRLSLVNKEKITAIRNSKEVKIDANEIVLDDIIILKAGEQVPCDGIILDGKLELDESSITGESLTQRRKEKETILSGTYVISGTAYVRINHVGKDNYINALQDKAKDFKSPKSLMYVQLNYLFKGISVIVILIGILMILQKGLLDSIFDSWEKFEQNVAPVAGALISMIPSGMYLLASTSLVVGVINLAKENVLVQNMYSIETLARIDTLCLDKTGTLTDGSMSVKKVVQLDDIPFNKDKFDIVMGSFNKAVNDNNFTATALINSYGNKGVYQKIDSKPFSSERKYSIATLEEIGTICVGAYGFVPAKTSEDEERMIDELSKEGYRILVVGYTKKVLNLEKTISNLDPIALIVIEDGIREGVKDVIKWFNKNNVDLKIISGDNPYTVSSIAETVGVINFDKFISLDGKTDDEVREAALKYTVFGRVKPEQKEIIIETLRKNKHTVGMFGDGINDTLALKSSDVPISISCATKAAKDVSSIILLNDNFNSLPQVISQGRRVINNLQRTCSLFLIKTIFAIIVNIYFLISGMIGGVSYVFTPENFYGWEIVTIGLAAFFLALEQNNNEIVKGKFVLNIFKNAIPFGIGISLGVIGLFIYFDLIIKAPITIPKTVSVYYMSILSLIALFAVCYKPNLYRSLVFSFALIFDVGLFAISYLFDKHFNLLDIDTSLAPLTILWPLLIALGCTIFLLLIFYFIKEKRKAK